MSTNRYIAARIAGAAVLIVGLAACGDDDDASDEAAEITPAPETTEAPEPTATPETTAAPETTASPATTSPEPADETAFCEPFQMVSEAFNGNGDPAAIPGLLDEIEATAPSAIAGPVDTMVTAARQVVENGFTDFGPTETPEFAEAASSVDGWIFEGCPFDATVEVAAGEFQYEGIASTYSSGKTAFRVTNNGAQVHELLILRRNDGVTESWDDILVLSEEEGMRVASVSGAAFVPSTGSQGVLIANLTPGDYVAVCFIPDGTRLVDGEFVEGEGQPHFMLGMRSEFTVT